MNRSRYTYPTAYANLFRYCPTVSGYTWSLQTIRRTARCHTVRVSKFLIVLAWSKFYSEWFSHLECDDSVNTIQWVDRNAPGVVDHQRWTYFGMVYRVFFVWSAGACNRMNVPVHPAVPKRTPRSISTKFNKYGARRRSQFTGRESRSSCQWPYNPPGSPHFGGLWEAAVRSTKSLLFWTMGTHIFTYEELSKLLTRIEAVLNSRPLTPLTADPSDLDYLSPGHFLIGQPLLAVPPRVPWDA